jgi:hypothetical protein
MIVESLIKSTGISEEDESLPNFCDPSNESTSKEGDLQTNEDDNGKSHDANPQPHTSAINHDETERVHEKASNNNDSAIDNDGGEWDFEDDIGCVSVNMFGEIAYTDPADRITITIKPWWKNELHIEKTKTAKIAEETSMESWNLVIEAVLADKDEARIAEVACIVEEARIAVDARLAKEELCLAKGERLASIVKEARITEEERLVGEAKLAE